MLESIVQKDHGVVSGAAGLLTGFYLWATDFCFCYNDIHLPVLDKHLNYDEWYMINTGALALANAGIAIANGGEMTRKKWGIFAASLGTEIASYVAITQALAYEKTGQLYGLAAKLAELNPLFEKVGMSMDRSFDIWNFSIIPLLVGLFGVYYATRS